MKELNQLLKRCDKLGQTTLTREHNGTWGCYIYGTGVHEFARTATAAVIRALTRATKPEATK